MHIYGFIDQIDNYKKYINNIDIFISSISNEERYIIGYNLINNSEITLNNKIIFYYNEVLNSSLFKLGDENKFDDSFELSDNDEKLYVDIYDEVNGLMQFKNYMKKNFSIFEDINIMIDFTVMVKPYFFLLIKHLLNFGINKLNFIYTEPDIYRSFTRGNMEARDIPSYSGFNKTTKKDALIILLGFEGYRAIAIYNEVNPELTIPINGFPSYKPEFKDMSILKNKELLLEENIFKNLCYAPAYDPFETKKVLNELYSNFSSDYNISIAPLGTKPMALGSSLFALEHNDCRIIYPYPLEYLPKASQGWRNTWIYVIKIVTE